MDINSSTTYLQVIKMAGENGILKEKALFRKASALMKAEKYDKAIEQFEKCPQSKFKPLLNHFDQSLIFRCSSKPIGGGMSTKRKRGSTQKRCRNSSKFRQV